MKIGCKNQLVKTFFKSNWENIKLKCKKYSLSPMSTRYLQNDFWKPLSFETKFFIIFFYIRIKICMFEQMKNSPIKKITNGNDYLG